MKAASGNYRFNQKVYGYDGGNRRKTGMWSMAEEKLKKKRKRQLKIGRLAAENISNQCEKKKAVKAENYPENEAYWLKTTKLENTKYETEAKKENICDCLPESYAIAEEIMRREEEQIITSTENVKTINLKAENQWAKKMRSRKLRRKKWRETSAKLWKMKASICSIEEWHLEERIRKWEAVKSSLLTDEG